MAEPGRGAVAPGKGGGLHRILGRFDGMAIIVGLVIGAGILGTPGQIAAYLGRPALILAMWVLGGVIAVLSALVFAEMAAMLPGAGGKYVYAREAFGPVAGFVTGWSELLATRTFSAAVKVVLIADYVISLTGGNARILVVAIVLAYFLLHAGGLRAGRDFQNIVTALKVAFIAAIIVAGFAFGGGASWHAGTALRPGYGLLAGLALAYQSISFTYYGWDDAVKMAEEVEEPGRNLPWILFWSAIAVMVLYLAINTAFLHALTPAEMAGSTLVARDAVAAALGGAAGTAITVVSIVVLASSLNGNFLGLPRVAFGLARDGLAPRVFQRVGDRGTPIPGLVLAGTVILSLAITGAFELLIRYMMFIAISIDAMVMAALFMLRWKRPDADRPFKVPGYPVVPAVVILAYVTILGVIVAMQPGLALRGGGMLAGLVVVGVWWGRRLGRAGTPA